MTEAEARALTAKLLSFAKSADDAIVNVYGEQLSNLRFAENSFLTSGESEERAANITVWIGGKRGSATSSSLDEASLRSTVELAEQIARTAAKDEEYLPTLAKQTYKPVNAFIEATANVSLNARAKAVGDILAQSEREKVVSAGYHQARASATASATKNGNFSFERRTVVGLSMTARTPDGASSGYFARNHFDVAKLDTARIAREAIRKAVEGRNARALDPGVYSVILEPQAVSDIMVFMSYSFDARSADEGRSPYSAPGGKTRLGEKLFDERINIYSDPWNSELPGSQAAEAGIPAQRVYLVRDGVVQNLIYSRFWAKKNTKEPTPGPVNTIMESSAPATSMDEMIRSMKRGLVVSRLWYIRDTDPRTVSVTGLTRDGVWYVENGKIQYPVKNFRFNQSIVEMLAPGNVEMIGPAERAGDVDYPSMLPALKLKAFNFTSQSEAV